MAPADLEGEDNSHFPTAHGSRITAFGSTCQSACAEPGRPATRGRALRSSLREPRKASFLSTKKAGMQPRGGRHYSARSAPAGETPLARNAGTTDATSVASPSTTTETAVTPKL